MGRYQSSEKRNRSNMLRFVTAALFLQLVVGASVLTQEQRQTLLKALQSQLPCNGALLTYFNIDVNLIGSGGAMTAWPEAWGAVDNMMPVAALDAIAAASFAMADVDGDNVLTRTCSACGKGGDGEDCPVFPRLWEFLPATNVDYRRCVYESPLAAFLFLFGSTTVENDQISAPTNWGEKDADGDGFVSIDELHAWTAQYKAGILAGPNRFSKVMAFAAALRWMKENVDCDNIDQLIA